MKFPRMDFRLFLVNPTGLFSILFLSALFGASRVESHISTHLHLSPSFPMPLRVHIAACFSDSLSLELRTIPWLFPWRVEGYLHCFKRLRINLWSWFLTALWVSIVLISLGERHLMQCCCIITIICVQLWTLCKFQFPWTKLHVKTFNSSLQEWKWTDAYPVPLPSQPKPSTLVHILLEATSVEVTSDPYGARFMNPSSVFFLKLISCASVYSSFLFILL